QDGDSPFSFDLTDPSPRVDPEAPRVVALRRVHDVEAVVGHSAPLGDRRLRRTDVHAAVDLPRIHGNDGPADEQGGLYGDVGLAGGGGTGDDEGALSNGGRSGAPVRRGRDG